MIPSRRAHARTRRVQASIIRGIVGLVTAVASVSIAPTAAFAHGVGAVQSTNVTTVIDQVEPAIPGVSMRVQEFGDWLSVTNRTGRELRVPGYEGEPYLRIGPDGVFMNRRSPAAYLNTTVTPTGPPPATADASADPEWRRVSSEPTYRWHDHRAHWMATQLPDITRTQPDRGHDLMRWTIPMQLDPTTASNDAVAITATGRVIWSPPTSPWLWLAGALVIAVVFAVGARTRAWRIGWISGCAVTATLLTVFAAGAWQFSTLDPIRRSFALVYTIAGIAISVFAIVWVARRSRTAGAPLILVTGVVLVFGTGLPGFGDLSASHVPTTLPYVAVRAITCIVLGIGAGLLAGGAMFLRPAGTSLRTETT